MVQTIQAKDSHPRYATSKLFATRNQGDLYTVLGILQRLSRLVQPI